MSKLGLKEKKFKGKKKVSNVLEKKAKGLKLNQVDRKKIVKIEQEQVRKDSLKKVVKAHLEKFESQWSQNDDDTRDSICSESSFGSQLPNREPKKRVSFASNIERTKVFDKNVKDLDIKPSDAEPGRGILRSKKEKAQQKAKKAAMKQDTEGDSKETPSGTKLVEVPKKKRTIQVTKKVKEQLLNMDRKERKAFLRQLKAQKNPLADKAMEAKLLWEKVRSTKTPKVEKDDCISKLVGLVKGNASKFIYAHDTCRVIECLLALKRNGITNMLFDELTPEIVRMTKSKYARFFVLRMLKYGSKTQREIIINAFRGHAVSLMRIVHAAEVLETVYNDFANVQQRFDIISEFYGKEFVLFRHDKPLTLDEIIQAEPAKKKLILQYMEEHLQVWVEKTTLRLSLTHRLLLDFLNHCDKDQFINLIDSLRDKIPEIVHTPEGSMVAMKIIWNSSAKDRKLIVKNFKDLAVNAALEHYGHRTLQAIFDTVDDTVLINKHIVAELGHEIGKLVRDSWGEKVIHYLVHPRDGRAMDKLEIVKLQQGDSNPHSKKEKKDRYAELFKAIQEPLYTFLAANMEELIFNISKVKFLAACLETTTQYDLFDRKVPADMRIECNKAIVELCKQEFIPMDNERFHIIEHPSGNFLMNAVLRCDADLPIEERLTTALLNELNEEFGSWISCNKGCHILLKMINTGTPGAKEKIASVVNMKQLKEYTFTGARLLKAELTK